MVTKATGPCPACGYGAAPHAVTWKPGARLDTHINRQRCRIDALTLQQLRNRLAPYPIGHSLSADLQQLLGTEWLCTSAEYGLDNWGEYGGSATTQMWFPLWVRVITEASTHAYIVDERVLVLRDRLIHSAHEKGLGPEIEASWRLGGSVMDVLERELPGDFGLLHRAGRDY